MHFGCFNASTEEKGRIQLKNAIIYTRHSPRPNSQECDSCKKQEERCRTFCSRHAFEVIDTFSDEGISGGVLNRLGLTRAIDALARLGDVDTKVLIVDSVNRLARDMLVNLTIRHQVEQVGGVILYADETPDDRTPEGELFSNIMAAFASYERSKIRYATSRGMKKRQENGEWFGKPPVGYMLDPDCKTKLIRCEQEQKAIQRAFRWWEEAGYSSREIAECLTAEFGLFRGKPWSARTVRKILQDKPS